MFLFGRKNNAPATPASAPVSPTVTAPVEVAPATPPVLAAPMAPSQPSIPAPAPFTAPRGIQPGSRRLQQKVKKLRRELRVTGRTLVRQRAAEPKALFVLESPLPELAPVPVVASPEVEPAAALPAMPEIKPEAVDAVSGAGLDAATLQSLVMSSPAFVEMQYELVDLRHQLQALQTSAAVPAPAPALDEPAVKAVVAATPAVVEAQYELVDLRHQLQSLQNEMAALRAAQSQAPAALTVSQLAVVDSNGQVVANVSNEGVVSCSSIVFMAQR